MEFAYIAGKTRGILLPNGLEMVNIHFVNDSLPFVSVDLAWTLSTLLQVLRSVFTR